MYFLTLRFAVPSRASSKSSRKEAFGILPEAEVMRGPHWKWKNDDGKCIQRITNDYEYPTLYSRVRTVVTMHAYYVLSVLSSLLDLTGILNTLIICYSVTTNCSYQKVRGFKIDSAFYLLFYVTVDDISYCFITLHVSVIIFMASQLWLTVYPRYL